MYNNIYIKLSLLILFIIIICFLSIKKINKYVKYVKPETSKEIKIILYYDSNNEICLNFLDTIWRRLINKHKNNNDIKFIEININNNKRYSDQDFKELPKIYMINNSENIINPYTEYLSYDGMENFIIRSYEMVSDFN